MSWTDLDLDEISEKNQRLSEPSLAALASGRGDTPLLQAAIKEETAVLELLLAANAPADVKNEKGRGPQFGRNSFGFFLARDRLSGDRNPST